MTVSLMQKNQRTSRLREVSELLRELLSVEWKLLRRSRRTRWMLVFFGVISVFFGVASLLAAIFTDITTNFFINFLVYFLSATIIFSAMGVSLRSSFYDGLMSKPVSQIMIVHNIVLTFHIFVSCFFVLPMLAVLIDFFQRESNNIFMITSMFLYVLGIVNYLIIFLSALEPNRIELNAKSSEMSARSPVVKDEFKNSRLTGMIVLLLILSVGMPMLLPALFPATHGVVFPAIGVLGLAGLLFHAGWVRLITRSLEKRRYELLERFRGR